VTAESTTSGYRWILPAAALFAGWLGFLFWLAATTANPILLNNAQLDASPVIVTARVEDVASGRCTVIRRLTQGDSLNEIVVANLAETGASTGNEYLLPLQPVLMQADTPYRITCTADGRIPPLIYPSGDETTRQFEQWQQ